MCGSDPKHIIKPCNWTVGHVLFARPYDEPALEDCLFLNYYDWMVLKNLPFKRTCIKKSQKGGGVPYMYRLYTQKKAKSHLIQR